MATKKTSAEAPAKKKTAAKNPPAKDGTSKFAQFLKAKKIDTRRLLVASHGLEAHTREDRAIRHTKRVAKKTEGGDKVKETRKPKSGRPITDRALNAALTGGSLSGPVKSRILRAVNFLLEQKKSEKVDLKALF